MTGTNHTSIGRPNRSLSGHRARGPAIGLSEEAITNYLRVSWIRPKSHDGSSPEDITERSVIVRTKWKRVD